MAPPVREDPLIVNGHFESYNRPHRDKVWKYVYGAFLLFALIGGFYGAAHRNRRYVELNNEEFLGNPGNCPARGRALLEDGDGPQFTITEFMSTAGIWLVASAAVSFLVGVSFLFLYRRHAVFMTKLTIMLQIAVPAVMGVAAILSGQVGAGIIMFVFAGLAALIFYMWRGEIELCGRLLSVSAHGVVDNPGLISFVIISYVLMLAALTPMLAFITVAYTNGTIVANSARNGSAQCRNAQGEAVPCCMWQPDSWVAPYIAITSVAMSWTVFIFFQLKVYVISGTVAQWYFAPPGTLNYSGTTMLSVKHALGPSFGSLCFSSAILTAVDLARNAMEQARRDNEQNILLCLLNCVLQCVWTIIEFLTKFATVRMAISGEAFLTAGRSVTELLARNFLKTYAVWWFPPMVLNCGAFLLAAAWGILSYLVTYFAWQHRPNGGQEAALLGLLSFLMTAIVLGIFSSVILNAVDAVFICYAMDKDTQSVTKAEVHEVFGHVPVGVVVEQPGGAVQYGAPAAQQAGTYVPPRAQQAPYYDSSARV